MEAMMIRLAKTVIFFMIFSSWLIFHLKVHSLINFVCILGLASF